MAVTTTVAMPEEINLGKVFALQLSSKPQIMAQMVNRYPEDYAFEELLSIYDQFDKKVSKNATYQHSELNRLNAPIKIASKAIVGSYLRLTVDPSSIVTINGVQFVGAWDNHILEFPSTSNLLAMVADVNQAAGTIDVFPYTTGVTLANLQSAIPDGGFVINTHNHHADGATTNKGKISDKITYINQIHEISDSFEHTFRSKNETSWHTFAAEYMGKPADVRMEVDRLEYQEFVRFKHQLMNTLFTSDINATNAVDAAGQPILTTKGLFPYLKDYGQNLSYAAGVWEIDDYVRLQRLIRSEDGSMEYIIWAGQNLYGLQERNFNNTFLNGAITYGSFSGNKEKAVSLGFNSITVNGYTFHTKNYKPFSNPTTFGVQGFEYPNRGLAIPKPNGVQFTADDGEEGVSNKAILFRYQTKGRLFGTSSFATGGGTTTEDGMMTAWCTGGLHGTADNTKGKVNYHAAIGLQVFDPKKFITIKML